MTEPESATLRTLHQYRSLAADPDKVPLLTKDGTVAQFLAYVLEDRDDAIVTAALDTIALLCRSEAARRELRLTYGLVPALECLKLKDSPDAVVTRVDAALAELRRPEPAGDQPDAAGAARDGQRRGAAPAGRGRSQVVTLHVAGLVTAADRRSLEQQLVRVRGLVSVVFDMGRGRCTCRVRDTVSLAALGAAVDNTEGMAAYQVLRRDGDDEELVPVSKRAKADDRQRLETVPEELPEYLPEDDPDFEPGEGAVAPEGFFKQATGWISSATSFFSQSFYW